MIQELTQFIDNFFLHIEINNVNLPYWKLPRPHRSHPVSRLFRKMFEVNNARQLFGAQIALLAAVPLASQTIQSSIEPPLVIEIPETSQEFANSVQVTTQSREFVVPVTKLRFVGQKFKAGHPAYDLNSYIGNDILAFSAGQVSKVETGTFGLGKYVVLDHGHGLSSVYAHMQAFSVVVGETVTTGQKIGEVGMTGYTTGPHVHFEIHDNGVAIDPGTYLDL